MTISPSVFKVLDCRHVKLGLVWERVKMHRTGFHQQNFKIVQPESPDQDQNVCMYKMIKLYTHSKRNAWS